MTEEERAAQTDQRARLTCARLSNGDAEKLRDLLSALALWPGQEGKRRVSVLQDHNFNKVKR